MITVESGAEYNVALNWVPAYLWSGAVASRRPCLLLVLVFSTTNTNGKLKSRRDRACSLMVQQPCFPEDTDGLDNACGRSEEAGMLGDVRCPTVAIESSCTT